jgi:hypothetical protein
MLKLDQPQQPWYSRAWATFKQFPQVLAGKETTLLLGWFISLAMLYPLLRDRQVSTRIMFTTKSV